MFSNNLKKLLVVFWQHRNEKKQKHWNDVAKERDSRYFLERGREDSGNVNNEETVSFRLREAEILSIRRRETGSDNCVSFTIVNHKSGRWSGSMNGETLRLPERMTIRGVLLYFEGWVSCRIWCRRWRCQLLDFSSLLRIHLWIGSSTERRMN